MIKKLNSIKLNKFKNILTMLVYLIMIIVLILAIRTKNKNPVDKKTPTNKEETVVAGFEKLKNNNFAYSYSLSLDDQTYLYLGEKYNNKDKLSLSTGEKTEEYFMIDELSLYKRNDEWVATEDKIYFYFNFLDIDLIEQIISKSSYNEKSSSYEIASSDLVASFDNVLELKEDSINYISLTFNNKDIIGIKIELNNFIKVYDENIEKAELVLNYEQIGKIKEFNLYN